MAQLLNNEEEDEFYQTCYGGFAEIEDDKEFVEKAEEHEEDYVDSDFDIDEDEEPTEQAKDNEDEEPRRKRSTRGVFTKAYKEPVPNKQTKEPRVKSESVEVKYKAEPVTEETMDTNKETKILRNTTSQKRKELEERQKERQAINNKLKSKKAAKAAVNESDLGEYRRLTQEELLAEAKITEEINLASLDAYQKLELERKKMKSQKYAIKGPVIRYHSVTMPFIDIDQEMYGDASEDQQSDQKQSRNFMTFPDEEYVKSLFPCDKPEPSKAKKCAVTGLPAKYFDPLTNCPYANTFAFKKLREIYEIAKEKQEKAEKQNKNGELVKAE